MSPLTQGLNYRSACDYYLHVPIVYYTMLTSVGHLKKNCSIILLFSYCHHVSVVTSMSLEGHLGKSVQYYTVLSLKLNDTEQSTQEIPNDISCILADVFTYFIY